MKTIRIYQADAFTEKQFSGNPAAVCLLDEWINDEIMQKISFENNLAETAFVVKRGSEYEIRWFTPKVEVDLCGHATLASAFVIFNFLQHQDRLIRFHSPRSGALSVEKDGEVLYLDFPTDSIQPVEDNHSIKDCIGVEPLEVLRGKSDFLAVVENEEVVRTLSPNLNEIAKLESRGLIVTAKGNEVDFVSLFFAPQSGIDEDPVTGSAHTTLIPLWSGKLGKQEMVARQLSKRGGTILCQYNGERCQIGGQVRLYLAGEIFID